MNHRHDDDLSFIVVDPIDDDLWLFEKLSRPRDQSRPAHVRQFRNGKLHHLALDASNHFDSGARIVVGDPLESMVELLACRGLKYNLHARVERKRLNTSSAEIGF